MRVRVYDQESGKYFKSEVYAILNQGWFERYVVLVPSEDGDYLKAYDRIDKSQSGPTYPVNINIINREMPVTWVEKTGDSLESSLRLVKGKNRDAKFNHYVGYEWLYSATEALASLMLGTSVPYDQCFGQFTRANSDLEGWTYVRTKADVDRLSAETNRFHDAVLMNLHMGGHNMREVSMVFESCWSRPIEVVFEGVLALTVNPVLDNYSPEIWEASIRLEDETILFADVNLDEDEPLDQATWVKAYEMRWRLL